MLGGVRGEKGEVPVFGDVPVEGVKGVQEDEEEPASPWLVVAICREEGCRVDFTRA